MRLVILLCSLLGCATLSASDRASLSEVAIVAGPTPMVAAAGRPRVDYQAGGEELAAVGALLLADGLSSTLGVPTGQPTSTQLVTAAGGPDAAQLLAAELASRLEGEGIQVRAPAARVRFEQRPRRWPAEVVIGGEWLLHAQVDALVITPTGEPRRLGASATLFRNGEAVVYGSCRVDRVDADRGAVAAAQWASLIRRCADDLLTSLRW